DPEGVEEISWWLSAAKPPVGDTTRRATPQGSQRQHRGVLCDPFRVARREVSPTGGFAALNHRLISVTPPASGRSALRCPADPRGRNRAPPWQAGWGRAAPTARVLVTNP